MSFIKKKPFTNFNFISTLNKSSTKILFVEDFIYLLQSQSIEEFTKNWIVFNKKAAYLTLQYYYTTSLTIKKVEESAMSNAFTMFYVAFPFSHKVKMHKITFPFSLILALVVDGV